MRRLLNTLYVMAFNRYLSLDGENVVVSEINDSAKTEVGRVPLHNLEAIVTKGHAGASPALMGECAKRNITLSFLSWSGKFIARVTGEEHGNVVLRREQYRIADDEKRSLGIARNMILGKVYNERWVLERLLRDHGERIDRDSVGRVSEHLKIMLQQIATADNTDSLRGMEGDAASEYFSVFDDLILQQKAHFRFTTRSRRPPLDNINAALSFSYTLLTSMCASALELVGLDPFVGVMHTERSGRRSLALDLVEELRSIYAERFVVTLINRKELQATDFETREDGAVLMTDNGRRSFLKSWEEKKAEMIVHPFLEEKVEWGVVPYIQALLLARHMRGDLDEYPAFLWK